MALAPRLSNICRLPEDRSFRPVGVGGEDPRDASAEVGQEAVKHVVERMVKEGAKLLASSEA